MDDQDIVPRGYIVPLPDGVTAADWALDRIRWQNPRIRSLLGCIRLLEGVLESNYAILHCSPARLREIWHQVRRVSELIRSELSRHLQGPSCIPALEEARVSVRQSLEMLDRTVLTDLEKFPEEVPNEQLIDVRKLLCVSIGKLHAFLQDTFGELLAGDPRSLHDADYYLSKRFPRDIEEAEWLHSSVSELEGYINGLEKLRFERLTLVAEALWRDETLPAKQTWDELSEFLRILTDDLAPRLTEILALRGIRFYEMEVLDEYAAQIPVKCRLVMELGEAGRKICDRIKSEVPGSRPEREQSVQDLLQIHAVLTARLVRMLRDLDRSLRDLWAFVPLWLEGIGKRRALLLRRAAEEEEAAAARFGEGGAPPGGAGAEGQE